ncbi:glycoside hydrolase family 2 [Aeoliella sp. ICT_H6.2]|uniref:Glycoside hydrolase family 2 n=1 Tax=Aeoliella straminimaris TaxID=2954799 RepID=A0A9X2FAP6_9BACT|nr:glycoside hydrolase family 2 [Aeoliella straminimaris]
MTNRPGCIWWWMGNAVDKQNLTANLEALDKAGMGGVTIVPIYGVKGREADTIEYLSEEWLEMLNHTVREADRLGMWVDMTPGTGWPYGGPWVTEADCDSVVRLVDGKLTNRPSGFRVKRAAPGAAGRAINPYSTTSLSNYLEHYDQALAQIEVLLPRAMYHDSFEFKSNWCPDFLEQFQQRRGYDLSEHAEQLMGKDPEDSDKVARIKSDYRETLSDLHLEYLRMLENWAQDKGRTTRIQAHGAPANLLDAYGIAGIPETETFGASTFQIPGIRREEDNVRHDKPQPLINRMASSAAHVMQHPLVASESCTWLRNHFRTSLSQIKPEIDELFLNGINHILFHGTIYSPQDAAWPGWLFYASVQYNPQNSIWHDAPALNAYITRCQSLLQSGTPDNDIALYWPVYDIWHNDRGMQQQLTVHTAGWLTDSECGQAAAWLHDHGYGFDFVSDRQLDAEQLEAYPVILVPGTEHIPVETMQALVDLAESGKSVIFLDQLPADVPGLHRLEERRAELKPLAAKFEDDVMSLDALQAALSRAGVPRESMVDQGLDFIRRNHQEGNTYFIANMSDTAVDGWVPLGQPFESAVLLDPQSAETGVAHSKPGEVYLQLLPGETMFVRTYTDRNVTGLPFPSYERIDSKAYPVTGQWHLEFTEGGPELPKAYDLTELDSWADGQDAKRDSFAGTGRYTIEFTLPDVDADQWAIDLGDVRESARVIVNGTEAATLYSVPYQALIGEYLKPGANTLVVEVTNLSANRIRDLDRRGVEWRIFHDANIVTQNYQRFDASVWPLTPSGLLGPVKLIPLRSFEPTADN